MINAYCVVDIKCCREIKKMDNAEVEESKEHIETRGGFASITKSGNIIFVYGCQPGSGVSASSKLIFDTINLFIKHFDPKTGEIILPDIFSAVLSSDAQFEVVTKVEA